MITTIQSNLTVKNELQQVLNKYSWQILSDRVIHEIDNELQEILHRYKLDVLQYNISSVEGVLSIDPIREIDRWAFKGIFETKD